MKNYTIKELEDLYPHLSHIDNRIELLQLLLDKLINQKLNTKK